MLYYNINTSSYQENTIAPKQVTKHRQCLSKINPWSWTLRAMTSQVSFSTKICSVQLDSCSGLCESWQLPIQLPSHNISRELQGDWAKSEVAWRHLRVMDSHGILFGSHHRCNDSVGGNPSWLITRSKGECAASFLPVFCV